jgi:rhodanese-related sulfurtransferase
MQHTSLFLNLVNEAKMQITETDAHSVNKMLAHQESFSLIDVREESEWARGHLPNAIHLSKGIIERDIEKHIPDTHTKIVLYCGGGFRSALAGSNLKKMGYQNVISMDGGFGAWAHAGFEIVISS